MIDLLNIEYKNYNERDIEVPFLQECVSKNLVKISSLLDVGAHYSWATYAPSIRKLLSGKRYIGVDILSCPGTSRIVDEFYSGNILELFPQEKFDYVICISTIEHSGLSTYKVGNPSIEREKVFSRLVELSRVGGIVTFPFGKEAIYPNEYANITEPQLEYFSHVLKKYRFQFSTNFYFNEFPQGRKLWNEISLAQASIVPMRPERGAQCICFLEYFKEE